MVFKLCTMFLLLSVCLSIAQAERQQMIPLKVDQAPRVDGVLDETCWQTAQPIKLSPRGAADEGIAATTVQAAYTDQAVYFAFTCREPDTAKLRRATPNLGLGMPWELDSVELFLDTDADMTNYLHVGVSAGATGATFFCEQPYDSSPFGGQWTFKSAIHPDQYTVEMEMPFSQFPLAHQKLTTTWNVAFGRYHYLDRQTPRIALWKGYQMDGLHHQPRTWGDLGPFEVNFSGITPDDQPKGPGGWDYPAGIPEIYCPHFPPELDCSLAWVKKDRLRILWGFVTANQRRLNNPQYQHTFQQVVDLATQSGFNVIVPCSGSRTSDRTPYSFWGIIDAMIRVRLAGARTMFSVPYLWNYGDDPALTHERYVSPKGQMDKTMICPLDPYPWRHNLVPPVLEALEETRKMDVPDLFFGVLFDIEPQANLGSGVGSTRDYCYSDTCWHRYAQTQDAVPLDLPADQRNPWLITNGQLDNYRQWQEKAVTELVRNELAPIREQAPALVFCFYPYHYGISWITQAVLAAVSTPRAPAIPMDDQLYWTGYSGKPAYMDRVRQLTIKYLGYEPFYVASIDYAEPPQYNYPTYTYDRAGREVYLMTRHAVGNIAYGGTRDPNQDLLENQKPFFAEGFAQAHQLLAEQRIIDCMVPAPPEGQDKARLEKAAAAVQTRLAQMWATVYGQPDGAEIPVTPGTFTAGTPLTATCNFPDGDSIRNTDGHSYLYDLVINGQPQHATLTINGWAQAPQQANLLINVNGRKIDYLRQVFADKHQVEVEIPLDLIEPRTTVDLAYFLGDSYPQTFFDNSIVIESIVLTLE